MSGHEDFRRAKELEEARKAGLAPAALDEDGKEINPHIPQYMSSAPWYLNSQHPSLKHQKDWRDTKQDSMDMHYHRGRKVFQATKFRKGACENCGAMTHKAKDCMERPRKKGAKLSGSNIAADELVEDITLKGFEAKRDRWNGYDTSEYSRVIDLHEKVEAQKQAVRQKKELERRFKLNDGAEPSGEDALADSKAERDPDKHSEDEAGGSDQDEEDEDRLGEAEIAGFGQVEKRVRTTGGGASGSVRNLRIREDTAKYLLNLDPNSAYYDPKSRSMRQDPNPDKDPKEKTFAGDNFVRKTGDYDHFQALNLHAVQAANRGQTVAMMANPSQAEAIYRDFKAKKAKLTTQKKVDVSEKYGNAASADKPEDELLLGQTEVYREYDASGRLLKGEESHTRSRYEEDVLINNHTAVWGSFWRDGQWGYACCHQLEKNTYCLGAAGLEAASEQTAQLVANMEAAAKQARAKAAASSKLDQTVQASKALWGSETPDDIELDQDKLKAALKKAEDFNKADAETDLRKRKYNAAVGDDADVTPEEMEAYRMKRQQTDDPLANLGTSGSKGYDLV
mmetsp:Transcript_20079/g.60665  ORF Transcript_20079/g.60665 Transcript_20079/m.60665 type:complete len:566 (-) Transcript_20079:656-2353(-)|eukprot:CAMPEP_0206146300 /NCGR_PEP_ID=MMETSP1473-20131121/29958_1 /ASSEMBLY_ACC=CAM_ASM_001109 /TAXON_ID=1461547 /ORGANISM="Stichococcus sp, Strain RCC1054" /LENGTH=565 /DNA_ID=CAMNT_0053542801 /DNA_START=396 /DNA_END=2093 /DNA_ORIENTATION=+